MPSFTARTSPQPPARAATPPWPGPPSARWLGPPGPRPRPIVIHAPDWDVYRALRGTYFDLLAEPPGLVTRTEGEVVAGFASGAVSGEPATRARAEFRARFCSLEDGRAAERVVRRVWLGEAHAARRDPAAAGTPLL